MTNLEITFLGTGTSQGVPIIGCSCPVCLSPDPRDKRLRTAVLVRTPELVFAIDTPPDFRTQCLRESIQHLDAVVYTHSHCDHVLGFDDLRRFCEMEDRTMPIYASPQTMRDLRRVFQYAFEAPTKIKTYIRPEPVEIDGPFFLGKTELVPVMLPHGRGWVNGFVLQREGRRLFAYLTDCHAVPPEAEEAARGAEIIVLDALRHAAHSTHMSLEEAQEAAERLQAGRATYFTHMCHDLGHETTEASLPKDVYLAYDGLRLEIN